MKKKKSLIILCGVLAVLLIAMLCIKGFEKHKEKIKNADETIVSFDNDSVEKFWWSCSSSDFSFSKKDGVWVYDKDEGFPVDQDAVDDMLALVNGYGCSFIIEDPESLSTYGLSNPKVQIHVKTGEKQFDISLGGYSSMDEERYFSAGDGNVYLASKDIYDDFFCVESDFIKYDDVPEIKTIESFTLSGKNSLNIIYKEDADYCYSNEYSYYLEKNGSCKALSDTNAKNLVKRLTGISLDQYVSYNASDKEYEKYRLDNPDITAEANYLDSDKKEQSFKLCISRYDDETAYAYIPGSGIIYELDADVYDAFESADYDSLKPREIVKLSWDDVSSISVKLDGESYEFDVYNKSKDVKLMFEDEELEDDLQNTLIDAIEDMSISEGCNEAPEKKLEIEYTINLDNDDYPQYRVSVYRYDSESCLVRINGESYGLVSRSSAVDLMEAVYGIVL